MSKACVMNVTKGQPVFDLIMGAGVVSIVLDDGCIVQFPEGPTYQYDSGGHMLLGVDRKSPCRALYFTEPSIEGGTEPPKKLFHGEVGDWIRVKSPGRNLVGIFKEETDTVFTIRIWVNDGWVEQSFKKTPVNDIEVVEYDTTFKLEEDMVYRVQTTSNSFMFRYTGQTERTIQGIVGGSNTSLIKPFNGEFSLTPTVKWGDFEKGDMVLVTGTSGVKRIGFIYAEHESFIKIDWQSNFDGLSTVSRDIIKYIQRLAVV